MIIILNGFQFLFQEKRKKVVYLNPGMLLKQHFAFIIPGSSLVPCILQ